MKNLRIIFAILLIIVGVFGVLCGGTFAGVLSLIGFGESNQEILAIIASMGIGILSLYISYLIIKYGILWIKRIKNKE